MFLDGFSLLIRNRVRKLFPESDSDSIGVIPKKSITKNFLVILRLTQFCHLVLGNWRSSRSPFVIFFRSIHVYFQRQKPFCKVSGPQLWYQKTSLHAILRRTVFLNLYDAHASEEDDCRRRFNSICPWTLPESSGLTGQRCS